MTTATATAAAFDTDRNGFPVETCGRCDGTGSLAHYRRVQGGTCFKCEGSGRIYPAGTVAKLAAQYANARKAARRATLGVGVTIAADGSRAHTPGVAVGDVIRRHADEAWRTVVSVRTTARIVGWCQTGAAMAIRSLSLETMVTLSDGEVVRGNNTQWLRRADLTGLRDALAAQARQAHARTLARRATGR